MTLLRNIQEPSGIPLSTKLGTWIENDGPGLERPRQAMKEAERFAKKGRISVETRSLSATYNCVGMVLASRRAVVSPDLVAWILFEDGYRLLDPTETHSRGDVVLYFDESDPVPVHMGVVAERKRPITAGGMGIGSIETWVLSQWGRDGEYLHKLKDVPTAYGTRIEYWTDRIAA